jgi:hypothetical protein
MGKLLAMQTAAPDRAAIIDEFGDIALKRLAFAPTEKRFKQLSDEMKSWYQDAPADKTFTEKGQRYQLDVSMCSNVTAINIRAVYKIVGIAKFLKACTLSLKAVGELLSVPEVAAVSSVERTGWRSLATTPISRPTVEASLSEAA